MVFATFDLQVTPMPPTEFQVNWPFDLGEEAKNRFSRRSSWRPSWISDQNDFLIYKSPRCFLPSFKSIGLLVQEKKQKIDFQDGRHGHLRFPIEMILAIFDLQDTPMLPTKFQVSWPFGSEKDIKKKKKKKKKIFKMAVMAAIFGFRSE